MRPVPTTAHECSAPAATDVASPPNDCVRVAVYTLLVEPLPTWPDAFLPQHHTSFEVLLAHMWPVPISSDAIVKEPGIPVTAEGV